jgi:isoleucyl-tRNA synthetase
MERAWWETGVFYQIYVRSFQDSNGDGIGDLLGIEQRLSYFKDLGVEVLLLSPIFPSSKKDGGYDITEFRAIDPDLGTMDDFLSLIAKAHANDITIVLDLQVMYTSTKHAWFQESQKGADSDKNDFYFWSDTIPNNWRSYFGGKAWTKDEKRGQYYLHSFLPEAPDLNWRNEKVVQAMKEELKFWLDLGVDGYKINGINLLVKDKTLRNIALSEIEKTLFVPETGRNRLTSMVANRPDWCISRQRDWGVPIAFFRVKETGAVIFDEKVLNYVAMIFEMQGSDAWYSMSIEELLYPGSGYKAEELEKVSDILDVWFDSGSTWNSVLKSRNYDAGKYQADLYVEGSDQHRGWFQSSLFLSSAVESKAPYKGVLTHGFTVDEKGEKMSKSKGNVIAPEKVLKEYGSEILRLWVASSDYQGDLKISQGILKQISENYRKLRNTFRIMLANINDLETLSSYDDMGALDKWILDVSAKVFADVHKSFSNYNFVHGMSILNNFIANELSGMYIDMTKDSLYCNAKNDPRRMASQSAMAIITKSLLLLMAPILTYTTDEIIEHAPAIVKGDAESIFDLVYTPIAAVESNFNAEYMVKAREGFGTIVDKLKKEKVIKSTLELIIYTESKTTLDMDAVDAEDWFVVSGVFEDKDKEAILGSFKVDEDTFTIAKATAHKCPRCWKFQATEEDCTCARCESVVSA